MVTTQHYTYYKYSHKILVDIATRAASALGLEVERYIDAGYKLKFVNIVNDSELKLYRKAVRFRNIVVYGYSLISPEMVRDYSRMFSGKRCK